VKLKKDEKADTDALLRHLLSSRIAQGPFCQLQAA
jgi:hypothetical protein